MHTTSHPHRFLRLILALSTGALPLSAFAQTAGDYRSVASGTWNDLATWESYDGETWNAAAATPTAVNAGSITIAAPHVVTNSSSLTADQIVVATGATLAASSTLTVANGNGVDLDISGTLIALGGGSVITLQAGAEVNVRSGGVFAHNGSSGTCVNNSAGGIITFENGGKFLLVRSGGTIPTATWNSGSVCEVNYGTASTTRPGNNSHGQAFHHFHWNNTNQAAGNDLANTLTNVAGNLTIDAGVQPGLLEFKLFNSGGSGHAFYGGDIIVNAGRFNWASAGGPYVWTLRGDLIINAGTAMDVSGTANGSYTLLLDSGGVQNYTCDGQNTAVKLNWTVATGTTLNLNNELALTAGGRTLTADGIVNLNGHAISADLVAGTGTIRNQSGSTGILTLGAGNGNNTLDGSLTLADGAAGTLGLAKSGAGTLTITAAQTFSGGLTISSGTVLVENPSGSGTGDGEVLVNGGTLGGNGIIAGPVTVNPGATLAPGTATGRLTVNNTLTLSGNTLMEVDKFSTTNDVVVAATVNYGGTLTVTDVSGGLAPGDSFQIFQAGAPTGDFFSISGEPGPNLGWEFNPATGVLSVIAVGANPPTLLYSQSGNSLTLSWADAGYKLQAQTNDLATGISSNWGDYPDGANPVNVNLDAAAGSVFFRLAPQ